MPSTYNSQRPLPSAGNYTMSVTIEKAATVAYIATYSLKVDLVELTPDE